VLSAARGQRNGCSRAPLTSPSSRSS
jgi:hypothetical protein